MSNPAIVLMTDPSRCSLGDVHHLMQALLEMHQMGEHATSQAFCDHPAAARDFIDAYAHAYPQLVLQGQEIPTPDHLQSLIAAGQIGALARPPEIGPNPALGATRPAEQYGHNLPIVVLTLGTSQVLIDALQQSPGMKDSIRLIDIVSDGADSAPVSIADAVAIRGLDGDSWEHEGSSEQRAELDDIAGAEAADTASLAAHSDPMNLDVVETDDVPASDPAACERDPEPATISESATTAAQPGPVVAESAVPPQDDGLSGPAEPASPPEAAWSSDAGPAAGSEQSGVADAEPLEEEAAQVTGEEQGEQAASSEDAGDDEDAAAAEDDGGASEDEDAAVAEAAAKDETAAEDDVDEVAHGDDDEDDVEYPPVGSLIAGADVAYPALDQSGPYGALHELAAVILDDEIVDPDLAADLVKALEEELPPVSVGQDAILPARVADNVVTIEDLYGSFDPDDDDSLADSGSAPPGHDSDL